MGHFKGTGLKKMSPRKIKPHDMAGAVNADQPGIKSDGAALPEPLEELEGMQAEEIEQLRAELAAVQANAGEYLDSWQRVLADFTNYKRRVDRDQLQIAQNTTGNAVRRYLDIADDLERALKKRPQDGDGATWAQGIDLIYRKLLNAFEADGVLMIEAEGQFFDPNLHEAITQEESTEHESGQVIGIVQPGYRLGERILRPAKVRVAR